ncbi:MAG: translation initiation factor IF-2 [archaeon]|nr:translation initiation factor IF-2 [archaeon]
MIRKPIIVVMGHTDAGKSSLLDKIRGTNIVEKEAGGITQHIGATEVPIEVIEKAAGELLKKYGFKLSIPGLLFIDTPGHEAFTNLRKRGGSIADLAVLIIDINAGIQNQTVEAIEILKTYKTPFIVALTKLDLFHGWHSQAGSVTESFKHQYETTLTDMDTRLYEIVGKLFEKGFNTERFDRVTDFTKQIPIIPVSSKTGEGIPEVLMFLAGLSQKFLEKELIIQENDEAKATVLEVKEEKGLGKTIDVILYDGSLSVGEEIVLMGKSGIIKTKIRSLLQPKPLQEIRFSTEKFLKVEKVSAAAGVKISAPNLDEAMSGSPVRIVKTGKEEKEILQEISSIKIESEAIGPIVRADALGSLEALIKLFEAQGVKLKKADVGEVSRKDVIEAEAVKEKDAFKGVIFAFHTKINPEAVEEARLKEVKIFESNIVYKLIEDYTDWVKTEKTAQTSITLQSVVFPAKLLILHNHIFRASKPAIVGVKVIEGKIKTGVQLMNKGKVIGKIDEIQSNAKNAKEAKKDEEVAVSIKGAVAGKHFVEGDELISYIPISHFKKLQEISDSLSSGERALIEEIKNLEEASIKEE